MSPKPFGVLFVCTGNLCRSPLAEGLLRRRLEERGVRGVAVASAGVYAAAGRPAEPLAASIARQNGVDLSGHRSALLTRGGIESADLVLAMEKAQVLYARSMVPGSRDKVFLLKSFGRMGVESEIEDPMGQDVEAFADCYAELEIEIDRIVPLVLRRAAAAARGTGGAA